MAQQTSAYQTIYSAVVTRLRSVLVNTGVYLQVGGTAGYPRAEVHTITEAARLDKEGGVRTLSLTVECMSSASLNEAATMNRLAMQALTENALEPTGWRVLGVLPDQLQDLTETSDSAKILYRLIQTYDIIVENQPINNQ